MTVADAILALESFAPQRFAAVWDNTGLILGTPADPLGKAVLLTIDLTSAVLAEALDRGCRLIIAYHPPIFAGVSRLTDTTGLDGLVLRAARAGVAIYSPHTALDAAPGCMSDWLASVAAGVPFDSAKPFAPLIGAPGESDHVKLITFVPAAKVDALRSALAAAGAGVIGDYAHCTFATPGEGTFIGGKGAQPALGAAGRRERVAEVRFETVCPRAMLPKAMHALHAVHPYETPAVDVVPLVSPGGAPKPGDPGSGRVVDLPRPIAPRALAKRIAAGLKVSTVSLSADKRLCRRIAVCPGAGESLLDAAIAQSCDGFVTGEMKHHDVLAARRGGVTLILAGHTQTERGYLPHLRARLAPMLRGTRVEVSRGDGAELPVFIARS